MTDPFTDPAEQPSTGEADAARAARAGMWPLVIGYVGSRLLLTVALAGAILGVGVLAGLQMPLLVALMLALVLQLPLSWLLLRRLRDRATAAMAEHAGDRRKAREALRAALAGESEEKA